MIVPAAAISVMGKDGAVATLLTVFLAVVSGFAAEVIAVSCIFTYDIYRTYINQEALGKQLIYFSYCAWMVSRLTTSGFAIRLYL